MAVPKRKQTPSRTGMRRGQTMKFSTKNIIEKIKKISIFLTDFENIEELLDYFEHFNENLSKKTLNSYLKSVSNA